MRRAAFRREAWEFCFLFPVSPILCNPLNFTTLCGHIPVPGYFPSQGEDTAVQTSSSAPFHVYSLHGFRGGLPGEFLIL